MSERVRLNLWELRLSHPIERDDGTKTTAPNYANVVSWVVTDSAEAAIALTKRRYPEADFHKIERRTNIYRANERVIVDPRFIDQLDDGSFFGDVADCNCGWGGTHDPDNPRCQRNTSFGESPAAVTP